MHRDESPGTWTSSRSRSRSVFPRSLESSSHARRRAHPGPEVGLLAALATRPYRITELAAREGITQPAVTQLVNRLERRGWVERRADPQDGRVVLVALRDEGLEAIDRVRAEYRALLHEEMASLDDDEVETLAAAVDILDRLIEGLGGRVR